MNEKQETTADIIDEIRRLSNAISDGIIAINGKVLASRLEAAWKREYDILNSEREKSRLYGLQEHEKVLELMAQLKAVGNAAAMREAVERVKEIAIREWNAFRETAAMKEMHDICEVALSKPPRNCDVGTEEEQCGRFLKFCDIYDCESDCPLFKADSCELAWAQMPYESEVKGERK